MQPDPKRLHANTVNRAGELAWSGNFAGWQDIETALLAEGYSNARDALRSQYLRNLLTEHCIEARRKHHA